MTERERFAAAVRAKERCKLLCEGVALHGTDLGLSEGVTAEVVAPKED